MVLQLEQRHLIVVVAIDLIGARQSGAVTEPAERPVGVCEVAHCAGLRTIAGLEGLFQPVVQFDPVDQAVAIGVAGRDQHRGGFDHDRRGRLRAGGERRTHHDIRAGRRIGGLQEECEEQHSQGLSGSSSEASP
jgi:hypothetical protein